MANTKNFELLKVMVRTLSEDATAESMAMLLEDVEVKASERVKCIKEKEELK